MTTGWSNFVTSKKLVAGDTFVFLRYIYILTHCSVSFLLFQNINFVFEFFLNYQEVRTESCVLESDVQIVNRAVCLHQSYQVTACISEFLLLHATLLKPEACSPFTTNQGIKSLTYWEEEFLPHFLLIDSVSVCEKNRTSQFIISLNKYLESMNNKFSVGMRFKMRFEGEDSPERR